MPTKKNHAQPKGEKKNSSPRKLPNPPPHLQKLMVRSLVASFDTHLVLLQEMIDEADRDGDGEINEAEFLRIMKKTSLY